MDLNKRTEIIAKFVTVWFSEKEKKAIHFDPTWGGVLNVNHWLKIIFLLTFLIWSITFLAKRSCVRRRLKEDMHNKSVSIVKSIKLNFSQSLVMLQGMTKLF